MLVHPTKETNASSLPKGSRFPADSIRRMAEILDSQRDALRRVQSSSAKLSCVEVLVRTPGKVITTGVGKSGLVARQFAATLCATGTPSAFLHPSDALHGDGGLIAPTDCLVVVSASGETLESNACAEQARQLNVRIILAITKQDPSTLSRLSDLTILAPTVDEPCRFGLSATATPLVMLAICNVLALMTMEKRGRSVEEIAARHPGGQIGRLAKS